MTHLLYVRLTKPVGHQTKRHLMLSKLYTKYESSGHCDFGGVDFFSIVSLWELMTHGVGPFFIPGAWLAGFIKRTIIALYII